MKLTEVQKASLQDFIGHSKFAVEDMYAGFMSEDVVANPDAALNQIAEQILRDGRFSKSSVLESAKKQLDLFELADTEDRERAALSVERLTDILGIENPEGRLRQGIYGLSADTSKPPE